MSKPSLTPSKSDLARESSAAAKFFTGPVPATYKGKSRGTTKDIAWRTNVAFWDAYDLTPAKLAVGDTAAVNAWLRIEAEGTRLLYASKAGTPSPTWNPDAPTWPLPTAPAPVKAGSKFAAKRPWNGPQTRYHTGIDLSAEAGTPVLAPEAGLIVDPDSGWDYDEKTGKGVTSIIMTTVSGFTVLIGGIRPGSSTLKAGQVVVAGQKMAEVGRYKGGDSMAHVNVYNKVLTRSQVNAQKKWMLNGAKPKNLIDPAAYLAECAMNPKYVTVGAFGEQGNDPGLVENDVEGGEQTEGEEMTSEFVFADNQRTSLTPCGGLVCAAGDAFAWTAATLRYLSAAKQQLALAKAAAAKGKQWTPKAAEAENDILVLTQFVGTGMEGLELDEVIALNIDSCREALAAGKVLEAFATGEAGAGPGGAKSGSGGGLGIILGIGAVAIAGTVLATILASRRAKKGARAAAAILMLVMPGCGPLAPVETSSGSGSATTSTSASSGSSTSTSASSGSSTSDGCMALCEPSCPVACQLGAPGMCEPPCDVPCPTICTPSGTCDLCTGTTGSDTGCSCTIDADCGENTCVSGRCMFACDNTCPITCQMGGSCDAPCDYTCPSACTNDGMCPVCDDPTSHTTGPTTG